MISPSGTSVAGRSDGIDDPAASGQPSGNAAAIADAVFTFPNRVVFGPGTRKSLETELGRLGISRPLVVTDSGLVAVGIVAEVTAPLEQSVLFDGVSANPTEANVLLGLASYRNAGCDGLIGLGGGSSIDTAKAIRLLVTHPGRLADYDFTQGGLDRITPNLPPMVAIPTTAGTGSEAGRGTLIQLPQTGRKTIALHPTFCRLPRSATRSSPWDFPPA